MLIVEFVSKALISLSDNIWSLLTTNAWEDEVRNWEDIT